MMRKLRSSMLFVVLLAFTMIVTACNGGASKEVAEERK